MLESALYTKNRWKERESERRERFGRTMGLMNAKTKTHEVEGDRGYESD